MGRIVAGGVLFAVVRIRIGIIRLLLLGLGTFIRFFAFSRLRPRLFSSVSELCAVVALILYANGLVTVGAICIGGLVFIFIVGLCFG